MPDRSNDTLRLAMVGGGQGSFIGGTHRMASSLDSHFELVAGALSSTLERSRASAAAVGIDPARAYGSWEELLKVEAGLPDDKRVDAIVVATPNHLHFPVTMAALEAGFHVVVDKPMVRSIDEAETLTEAVASSGLVLAVTYNYTGYPMVKEARELVRTGEIGDIRKVIVEFHQGWLARRLEAEGQKQAEWRMDPERAGVAGSLGDIGTHAENLMSTITGLDIQSLCADLTAFVPGRALDDDANILLRFTNGAKGVLMESQATPGEENNLRIRVYGTEGRIEWVQQEPDTLLVFTQNGPERVYRRGSAYLSASSLSATRLPPGLPEAFIEAFANIYAEVARAIRDHRAHGFHDASAYDFPNVFDGARADLFVARAVESSRNGSSWVDVR